MAGYMISDPLSQLGGERRCTDSWDGGAVRTRGSLGGSFETGQPVLSIASAPFFKQLGCNEVSNVGASRRLRAAHTDKIYENIYEWCLNPAAELLQKRENTCQFSISQRLIHASYNVTLNNLFIPLSNHPTRFKFLSRRSLRYISDCTLYDVEKVNFKFILFQTIKMLRWGILGTSFISHTVAASIAASQGSKIHAVFGRDTARLTSFADKFSIEKRYGTIDELLADSEVDVVYVGLPSHLHASASIAAAKAGKAILSEKSLTTTTKDAKELIGAVKESGVFFLEGLMYLSHPLMEKVAEVIQSGKLGPIKGVSGYYAANIWKKANPLGMGTIYNLGCYPLSLMHWVMQAAYGRDAYKSRKVHGLGNLSNDGSHVRDASYTARFGNGVLATLQSTDSFGNDFSFAIQGEKAVLQFKTNPWLPPAGDSVMEVKTYRGSVEEIVVSSPLDAFGHQIKRVEECVAAGVKEAPRPSPTWEDSLEIMELLNEWEESITGRTVG